MRFHSVMEHVGWLNRQLLTPVGDRDRKGGRARAVQPLNAEVKWRSGRGAYLLSGERAGGSSPGQQGGNLSSLCEERGRIRIRIRLRIERREKQHKDWKRKTM